MTSLPPHLLARPSSSMADNSRSLRQVEWGAGGGSGGREDWGAGREPLRVNESGCLNDRERHRGTGKIEAGKVDNN